MVPSDTAKLAKDLKELQRVQTVTAIDWGKHRLKGLLPDLSVHFPELEEFRCNDCNGLLAPKFWSVPPCLLRFYLFPLYRRTNHRTLEDTDVLFRHLSHPVYTSV